MIIDCPGCGRAYYSTTTQTCDRCGFTGPPPQTGEQQLNGAPPEVSAPMPAALRAQQGGVTATVAVNTAAKDAEIAALRSALELLGQAARDEEVKALREALAAAVRIAEEAREEWDKAPEGMRAGKLLCALAGRLPSYRADITHIHKVLAGAIGRAATHRHVKGKAYTLLGYGIDTETSEEVAIYIDEGGGLFSRPKTMFDEITRFAPIVEEPAHAPHKIVVEQDCDDYTITSDGKVKPKKAPRKKRNAEASNDAA